MVTAQCSRAAVITASGKYYRVQKGVRASVNAPYGN